MNTQTEVMLMLGIVGVWIQVIILAYYMGLNKSRLDAHTVHIEDHELRMRAVEGKLSSALGYKT